jgi:hypothetical protein
MSDEKKFRLMKRNSLDEKNFSDKKEFVWIISGCSLVLSIVISVIFYLTYNFTQVDSARYLLSSLAQSEAAILATAITLSLVAIQLAASSYSRGVTENFKRSPALWGFISLYIASIVCSLSTLKLIRSSESIFVMGLAKPKCNSDFELYICLCFFLGVLCFTLLVPYTYNMFMKLKPSKIIEELSQRIIKSNFKRDDPIHPIIELAQVSITKNDFKTTKECLDSIRKKICTLFEEEDLDEDEETKISMTVRKHLSAVGRLAIDEEDRDSASEVISIIKEMGMVTVEKGFRRASKEFVLSLEEIGMAAIEKVYENISLEAASCLNEIGIRAAERGLEEVIWDVILSLRRMGMGAIRGDVGE